MRRNILTTAAFCCLAILPSTTLAQQQQHVSFNAPAANAKYTQSLIIPVADVPNHSVRVFEIHRTFPNDAPVIGGLKLVENWARGAADLTGGNGTGSVYDEYVMENGDKFFCHINTVVQAAAGKSHSTQVGFITGGTGKFAGIHGVCRGSSTFDIKAGTNESHVDIDYAMGK